jgi:hypothetical protein
MAGLEPGLKARLKQLKVRIDKPDDDTLLLRNVPADSRRFSKPRTSLLVKRPRAGLPFLVCVDEDLEYLGPDRELARVFAAANRQQGWRVVSAGSGVYSLAEDGVQQALAMLGAPGSAQLPAKAAQRESGGGLLARFAVNLTAQVRDGPAPLTVGREEAAEQTATSLLSWQRRLPVMVGAPGLGKTNLLYKVARHLAEVRPDWDLLSVDLSCLLAGALWEGEREKLLNVALEEAVAAGPVVLALERLELAVMTAPLTPWLLAGALDRGARLAATCLPPWVEKAGRGPADAPHGPDRNHRARARGRRCRARPSPRDARSPSPGGDRRAGGRGGGGSFVHPGRPPAGHSHHVVGRRRGAGGAAEAAGGNAVRCVPGGVGDERGVGIGCAKLCGRYREPDRRWELYRGRHPTSTDRTQYFANTRLGLCGGRIRGRAVEG